MDTETRNPPAPAYVLEIGRVRKTFGRTTVLAIEGQRFEAGRVYGLLGANGSGKSTLVKILSGYHHPDQGAVGWLRGREIAWPLKSGGSGIAVVQQEYAIVDSVSVTENFLAVRARGRNQFSRVRWSSERQQTRSALSAVGLVVDPRAPAGTLASPERALLSIARAIEELEQSRVAGGVLILDEPTANLGHADVERVLEVVRLYASRGAVVILVNHRLAEIRSVCDEVLVLRNGEAVLSGSLADFTDDELLQAMFREQFSDQLHAEGSELSRESGAASARTSAEPEPGNLPLPERQDRARQALTLRWPVDDPSNPGLTLEFAAGEVVGFTGLVGMGQDELPYLIFGSEARGGMEVWTGGRLLRRGAREAWLAGLVIVPGNRARDALWLGGSVKENYTITRLRKFGRHGRLVKRLETDATRAACVQWRVVAQSVGSEVWTLSGGNQQKLVLARAVAGEQWGTLIAHEPTQGTDIETRKAIHQHLVDLAAAGKAVLVFGADYESLAAMCNRVFVMSYGRICEEITVPRVTEGALAEAAMQADWSRSTVLATRAGEQQ